MAYSLDNRGRPLRTARLSAKKGRGVKRSLKAYFAKRPRKSAKGKTLFAASLLSRRGRLSAKPGFYVKHKKGKGRRSASRGKSQLTGKGRASRGTVWKSLVKKYGVKAASAHYRQTSAWGGKGGSWRTVKNGLAVIPNPFAMSLSPRGISSQAIDYALGVAAPGAIIFYSMDYAAPFLAEHVYSRAADLVAKIPVVGDKASAVIVAAPHAITGAILGTALGSAAAMTARSSSTAGIAAGPRGGLLFLILGAAAAFAPIYGFIRDWESIKDAAMGALAIDGMGGLAYTNGMGAIGLEEDLSGLAYTNGAMAGLPFGDALGDGMYFETAPLSASALNYTQASLADAAYSGADFSVDEGQALLNGTFGSVYGAPTTRAAARASGPSHLAGRRGHRWGWLFKMVGPDRTRNLAAMAPSKRVKLLNKLRAQAISTFQMQQARQSSSDAASIAAAQGAGSATSTVGGMPSASAPCGPSGPSGFGEPALGAALFMGE